VLRGQIGRYIETDTTNTRRRHAARQDFDAITFHRHALVTVEVDLPLFASPVALQLELEVIVVVGTDLIATADPIVEHAHATNVRFVTEIIGCVFSCHGLHTVPT